MEIANIISIVVTALFAGAIALAFYFKVHGNVLAAVTALIAAAEATGLTGAEKMAQVVAQLSDKIPAVLKGLLSKERLEKIAQWIFDRMREYADLYRKALEAYEKDPELKNPETEEAILNAAAEMITELFGMNAEDLKAKAEEFGVKTEGLKTKRDYIRAIVLSVMNIA